MLVMTLERVPPALRGELTRWLVELQQGVYVGRVSPVVRDLLWERAVEKSRDGRCAQAWRAPNEQGFEMRIHGDDHRHVASIDGLLLIFEKSARWQELQPDIGAPSSCD